MAEPTTARRHDLDALRAFAMLLGIALHAGLSFAPLPWPVQDSQQNGLFYLFFAAVHGFRMPLFFLLSGFFTAMLWRRRGLRATLWHRTKRILLPCLLGVATIVPLVNLSVWWSVTSQESKAPAEPTTLAEAARWSDVEAVKQWLAEGADPNDRDPDVNLPALSWAAMRGDAETARALLDAGADVNGRNPDNATALHGAAFFGHDEVVALLVERGADLTATTNEGYTAWQSSQAPWMITEFAAGFLQIDLPERGEVTAGRERAAVLLADAGGGFEGDAEQEVVDERGAAGPLVALRDRYFAGLNSPELSIPRFWTSEPNERLQLVNEPVFHHLWFLWFLCWLTPMFGLYAWAADRARWTGPPRWLVLSPARWLWLLPLTLLGEAFMHFREAGFGPDTSVGLLPMPHVLAYYALFYFFGALYYDCDDTEGRVGRWWLPTLLVSGFLLFPAALVAMEDPIASRLLQALYVWMMCFGLMGLCRRLLRHENATIRYISDSSYWLYVAHLPLVFIVQAWVRDWAAPSGLKFLFVCVVVTTVLLVSYQTLVRYTWIGRLLNGPRQRPQRGQTAPPAGAAPSAV